MVASRAKEELKKYVYEVQFHKEVVLEIKNIEAEIAKKASKYKSFASLEDKELVDKDIERLNEALLRQTDKLKSTEAFIAKVENTIAKIGQPLKNILYFRYVKLYKYSAIAVKMGYSIQRIFQLNREALKKYENFMQ